MPYNKPMDWRRLTPALAAVLSTVALLTGCGGAGTNQKTNDAYASSVCGAIGSWLTEVKSVETVPSLTGVTKPVIQAKLNHFQVATRHFVSQIKAAPAPDTAEGHAAKTEIERQLVTTARGENTAAETAVSTVRANASKSQLVQSLIETLPGFQSLKPKAQETLTSLQTAGGPLASAFKSEQPCTQLG